MFPINILLHSHWYIFVIVMYYAQTLCVFPCNLVHVLKSMHALHGFLPAPTLGLELESS